MGSASIYAALANEVPFVAAETWLVKVPQYYR